MSMIIKGGEPAIQSSYGLIAEQRRGDPAVPELSVSQIREQLGLGVDRVMADGALYDRTLAALAIKQAQCDIAEAVFLLRAFRTTLRRFGTSMPIDTTKMLVQRRVATVFKDPPGGQFLGPTYDYTHRLLDFSLLDDAASSEGKPVESSSLQAAEGPYQGSGSMTAPDATGEIIGHPLDVLISENLLEPTTNLNAADERPADLTREPLAFPAARELRLQALARGDEGFLVGVAYSSMQGYGAVHPYIADLRIGDVMVEFMIPELGFTVAVAEITVTSCQIISQEEGEEVCDSWPRFTRGYSVIFGKSERKALSAALLDLALRVAEMGGEINGPARDQEFVLSNSDGVATAGLIQHLKLPHYVDFQGRLQIMRKLRDRFAKPKSTGEAA